eukprot:3995497-Pleurochrysis_carterae.AAC.1
MADPAAAPAPASDPAPADPPDAEAAAAARIEHHLLFSAEADRNAAGKVWDEHHNVDGGRCRGHLLGRTSMGVEERSRVKRALWHEAVEVAEGIPPCKRRRSDAGLDSLSLVTTHERSFDDIYSIHVEGGHRKARTFYMAVHNRFGRGVPRWVCDLLCETCPLC